MLRRCELSIITQCICLMGIAHCEAGPLSYYAPGDGQNQGTLACGGKFTNQQHHIAYRRVHKVGCYSKVIAVSPSTSRAVLTQVADAGPFGIIDSEGRRKVHVGTKAPKGWKFRAVADLSYALWVDLGKPDLLAPIWLIFLEEPKTFL